jgi:hemerythrin
MPVIEWHEGLALDKGVMDETHREFVDLLNRIADAREEDLLSALDQFIRHTEEHFAQEQRWMEQMAFPPLECHVREHAGVLETAHEVRRRVASGETRFGQMLAKAVAEWFGTHASSMDHVLALYMKEKGFDPAVAAQ